MTHSDVVQLVGSLLVTLSLVNIDVCSAINYCLNLFCPDKLLDGGAVSDIKLINVGAEVVVTRLCAVTSDVVAQLAVGACDKNVPWERLNEGSFEVFK